MELLSVKAPGASSNTPVFVPWDGSERKNPGLAWGLSFLCPGAGQLYCGLWRSGLTTLIVFWCAVAVTFVTKTPPTWGIALRYALALWCFATLDAYFSARDINSGAAPLLQGGNPRVAAILNLTTKGWGYFYLGRKSAGIVTCATCRGRESQTIARPSQAVGLSHCGICVNRPLALMPTIWGSHGSKHCDSPIGS